MSAGRTTRLCSVLLSLALVSACQAGLATRTKAPGPKASTAVKANGDAGPIPLAEPPRIVPQVGEPLALTGKVKLISDHGGGIISNNGGTLLSNNGGSLISDKGGGVISNNGSGLTSKTKLRVLAAEAPAESLLADAQIELLDAEGHVLVDASKAPLTATTDKQGQYTFKAVLPPSNLLMRVRLWNGGQLFAVLPRGKAADPIDLDTASSFGASYVLGTYVKHRQAVFDRLPASEAAALHHDFDAARGVLASGTPSYRPEDQVAATEAARHQDATVDRRLETIKALLLAGQEDLGNGLPATAVALSGPTGVVGDAEGNLYISEISALRIRRVRDGKITVFAGTGARGADGKTGDAQTLEAVGAMAMGPDGALYATQMLTSQVRRLTLAGVMSVVISSLSAVPEGLGGFLGDAPSEVSDAGLRSPSCLAIGADGTFYLGESPNSGSATGHLWSADATGTLTRIEGPAPVGERVLYSGIGVAPDGTLWIVEHKGDRLMRRQPGATTWELVASGLLANSISRMVLGPDGDIYVSSTLGHQVLKFTPGGERSVVAGTGEAGTRGDGGPALQAQLNQPAGIWVAPDRTVYIADATGLVRAIDPQGVIRTVAGTLSAIPGDALTLPINTPGGLALDAQGRILIAEGGSSTVKRLEGTQLSVVVGTEAGAGDTGDGGPASQARLSSPSGIAARGDTLWIIDSGNNSIRKVDAQGIISTVVKKGGYYDAGDKRRRFPADHAPLVNPLAIAIGPDDLPYWTDSQAQTVMRLTPEGDVEVLAGTFKTQGDASEDASGIDTLLNTPTGLAFNSKGELFVADSVSGKVVKIDLATPERRTTIAAGITTPKFLAKLGAGEIGGVGSDEGHSATDTILMGLVALCFDAQDRMYLSELGSAKLTSFGGASGLPQELLGMIPPVGCRIRRVDADGTIRTVAGDGTTVMTDPSTDNYLLYPFLMLIDKEGRLLLGDSGLNQIKMLPKGSY